MPNSIGYYDFNVPDRLRPTYAKKHLIYSAIVKFFFLLCIPSIFGTDISFAMSEVLSYLFIFIIRRTSRPLSLLILSESFKLLPFVTLVSLKVENYA